MSKPKGGRGIKAPYQTTHVRVPVSLKPCIDGIIEDYRNAVMKDKLDPNLEIEAVSYPVQSWLPPLEEAKQLIKDILRQKKSARQSIAKLLTSLYSVDIDPKDL